MKELTNEDFCRAAEKLGCDVAAIQAVAEVESRGNGFYADGFPVILFERHKFHTFTKGRYDKSHPQISNPKSGGYGSPGQNQRNKFNLAFKLDPEAAMKSCSWGKFQIMGFNHKKCGFSTVGAFVDAMKASEGRQLDAFVTFVIKTGLGDELRSQDWAGFAHGYNGAAYKANKYDTKMAAAYKRFSKNPVDCSSAAFSIAAQTSRGSDLTSASIPTSSETPPIQQAENIVNVESEKKVPENFQPAQKTVEAPPKEGTTASAAKVTIAGIVVPGFVVGAIQAVKDLVADGYINAKDVGDAVLSFIKSNQKYVFILIGLLILLMILKKAFKQVTLWLEMWIASDPNRHDVEVKKS